MKLHGPSVPRNPVETAKPLVEQLEAYRWSSYPAYRNQSTSEEWLYKDSVLAELGSAQPTSSYKRFVEQGIDEETEKFYAKGHWPAVRGSEKFVDKAQLHSNASSKEVCRERQVLGAEVILALVSRKYGCKKAELLVATRGVGNTGRAMAVKLCQEYGGMTLGEISKVFGLGSDSGATKSISRLTHRMVDDDELKRVYEVLCQDLTS